MPNKPIEVKVEDLISLTFDEVMNLKLGKYHVRMSDGVVGMYARQIQMSSFYWAYMAEYNVLPTVECCLASELITYNADKLQGRNLDDISVTGNQYTSKTHIRVSSKAYWVIFNSLPLEQQNRQTIERNSASAYHNTNEIYNFNVRHLGAYVNTMSLKDVYEVTRHPVVVNAKAAYKRGELEVDDVYDIIFALLESNPLELRDNELRKGVMAGVLDRRSIAQTVGLRGFVKDTDGSSFKVPIDVGYAELLKGYDAFIESRSASRALYMTTGPLEKSEYYNRRIQICAASVRAISGNDCGSTHTLNFIMRADDLEDSIGKFIILEDGTLHKISSLDTYLIDTPVRMRTYTRCLNHDTTTVCSTCVGHNALILPKNDNFGHMMTIGPNSQKSQRILSTKHMEISMEALVLVLDTEARKMVKYSTGNKWLTEFKKPLGRVGYYKLRFSAAEAPNLNHVNLVDNVNDLTPTRISQLRSIEIVACDKNDNEINRVAMPTEVAGFGCSLTGDFLAYLAEHKWTSDEGIITVNLKNWEYGKTFMETPRRNTDVIGFLDAIESFLKKSPGNVSKQDKQSGGAYIASMTSVTDAVMHLKDLMSPPNTPEYASATRIKVNISQVEIYVRMLMCRNPSAQDYSLPCGDEDFTFAPLHAVISNRTIGGALAFERQAAVVNNPLSYINENRSPHPLDMLV